MRVWQPGAHLSSIKKVEVDDWSWRRTRTAHRGARPADQAVQGAHRALHRLAARRDRDGAGAALPRQVRGRRRHPQARPRSALVDRRGVRRRRPAQLGDELRADVPHGLGRRAHPGRPAHRALPPSPAALPRFLRAHPRGRDHQPADERRRGDRPARHRRRHEPRPEQPHADRHGDPPLRPRLAARARDAGGHPTHEHRDRDLPRSLHPRVSRRPRAPGPRDGDARRGHRRHARRAGVHARGHEHAELQGRHRALPRLEHGDRRPERPLLPLRGSPVVDRARRRARLRRPSLLQRRRHARNALRLHALRAELLRPRAAAVAALQHVPLGDGGARQDHGRHGRGAGGSRPAGRTASAARWTAA